MAETSNDIKTQPITKEEIISTVEGILAAKNKKNKFFELLTCRRFISVVAVVLVVVAKHFGLNIDDEELLTIGVSVAGLVLSHGLRKPS